MTASVVKVFLLFPLLLYSAWTWAQQTDPPVTIGIVANNEPYSSYGPNGLQGFSIDLLNELSRISGIKFEYRVGSWSEIYAAFLRGELDAVDEISWRSERVGKMLFTEPYHLRTAVVMHDGSRPLEKVNNLKDLHGYRVGVLRDIYYSDLLKDAGLNVKEYDFQSDLVRALSFGWVDAVVGPELTLAYMARQQGFANLEVLTKAPLQGQEIEDFRIAVGLNNAELQQRLNEGLKNIDPDWIEKHRQRWQEYGGHKLQDTTFRLSPAERNLIRQQGPLRIGLMRDHAPLTFETDGRVQGLSVDVLHRLKDLTGLRVIPVVDQWSSLMDLFKRGEIDMVASMSRHPDRLAYTRFTEPYHQLPILIYSRQPGLRLSHPDDFNHARVGIGKNIFYAQEMRARLGNKLVEFADQASVFRSLANGQVDYVLGSLPQANHWRRVLALENLYVAGELKLEGLDSEDLRFGLRPELEDLVPIFNKALAAISATEKRAIEDRWLGAQLVSDHDESAVIRFSEEELTWLQQHEHRLRYCLPFDWMPIAGEHADGQPAGIGASLVQVLAERSMLKFEYQPVPDPYLALMKGQCDILPAELRVPEADPELLYSPAYYTLPTIVVGRLEAPFISQLSELNDKPVGILRTLPMLERLRTQYSGLDLVPVDTEKQGVKQVQQGHLYGYIGTLATTSHQLRELGFANVRVLGRVPMDAQLAVVTSAQQPVLAGIMNKLVASLSHQDIRRLDSEWRSVELRQSVDYRRLWLILLAAAVLLALMYFWVRKLRRLNTQLASANKQLEAVSSTDALTGLGNRVKFEQLFNPCFSTCQRNGEAFMVAVLDVDHFKRINDTYGHPVGDRCLEALSNHIANIFRRQTDCLIRFGGEEFVIFGPAAETEQAVQRLEKLRQTVEQMEIIAEPHKLRLTISIGYCLGKPARGDTAEQWLNTADACLYQAKNSGRNAIRGGEPH